MAPTEVEIECNDSTLLSRLLGQHNGNGMTYVQMKQVQADRLITEQELYCPWLDTSGGRGGSGKHI